VPERGSADELMDHGAAGELGPMRHSPRTSWPRRCSTCSPARSSGSGRSSMTASTTTSSCPDR
jgi:hypothetical protein